MLDAKMHQQLMVNDKWTFENMNHLKISDKILREIRHLVPIKTWDIRRNGVWQYFNVKNINLSSQGWKIHISATPFNLIEVAKLVTQYLVNRKSSFKVLADYNAYSFINSKIQGRGSSGKFITIYPVSIDDFKIIIEDLYNLLKEFEGPYILSDNRYKDSRCVYYRYGGLKANIRKSYDGFDEYVIYDEKNNWIIDERHPYYVLPSWIEDPFQNEDWHIYNQETDNNDLLNNRYEITEAIQFSSTGGVYKAFDTQLNKTVIIKEARPFTDMDMSNIDSVHRMHSEKEFLIEFDNKLNIPQYIDSFEEWEHHFLVIEYIEGVTFAEYINKIHPFMSLDHNEDSKNYLIDLHDIWLNIAKQLKIVHKNGWVIGDLSTPNIMIKPDTHEPFLIDFEGAYQIGDTNRQLTTHGFAPTSKPTEEIHSDIYGFCSMLLFSIFPVNSIQGLASKDEYKKLYDYLFGLLNVNKDLNTLMDDVIFERFNMFESMESVLEFLNNINLYVEHTKSSSTNNEIIAKVQNMKSDLLDSLKANMNFKNKDRLVSSDPTLFFTNKLGLAYGAGGIIHTLKYIDEEIPEDLLGWVLDKDFSEMNNGLYNGLSGLAWVFSEIGYHDLAAHILAEVFHTDEKSEFTMENGLVGIGLSSLKLFEDTGDLKWLELSDRIAGKIIEKTDLDNFDGISTFRNEKYLGLLKGSAGVAYLFLNLHRYSNKVDYLSNSKKVIDYILDNVLSFKKFDSLPRNEINDTTKVVASPYLYDGTSGLVQVLLLYWKYTKDAEIMKRIKRLLNDLIRPVTPFPSLSMGMAGILNTVIEAATVMETTEYDEVILDYINSLEKYILRHPENGISGIPGMQLYRISYDFATGSSGVICVLHRAQKYFEGEKTSSFFFSLNN